MALTSMMTASVYDGDWLHLTTEAFGSSTLTPLYSHSQMVMLRHYTNKYMRVVTNS